jgi:hypothetical protein
MRTLLVKILIITILGVPLKLRLEHSVQRSRTELKLQGTTLSIQLRSKLSQNLAIALFGGFRAVTADVIYIFQVHRSWEDQIWYKLKEGAELCVVLQPHAISFWDLGSWHMAWNASYAESINHKYPSKAYRTKIQQGWIKAGRDFLEQGIQNNPDTYDLYFRQGWLIKEKYNDPLGAVPYLLKANSFPNTPLYVSRMIGHMYEQGGKTQEAYDWWKQLWAQDHNKNPTQLWSKIQEWGREAEEKLNVPASQRIFSFKKESNTLQQPKPQ